jgi:hypothetical protein
LSVIGKRDFIVIFTCPAAFSASIAMKFPFILT